MTIMLLLERQNWPFFCTNKLFMIYFDFHYFYIAFLDCDVQHWTMFLSKPASIAHTHYISSVMLQFRWVQVSILFLSLWNMPTRDFHQEGKKRLAEVCVLFLSGVGDQSSVTNVFCTTCLVRIAATTDPSRLCCGVWSSQISCYTLFFFWYL